MAKPPGTLRTLLLSGWMLLAAGEACSKEPAAPTADVTDLMALPLEQLLDTPVFGASKFTQKSSEAPSAVTVITASDIAAYGYRTIADVLRSIRGLHVTYDRDYSYVGVRGFLRPGDYSTRVLLLVDGLRVNDNIYAQADLGYEFPVDLDMVDRVEFIPGPGSAIYGSNAFLGVVNVVTKPGRAFNRGEIKGEIASAETYRGHAAYGRQWDRDRELLLSVSGLSSHGRDITYPEFASVNGGVAQSLDYERAQYFLGKLTLGGFTFEAIYHQRTKGVPTASFGQVFDDPRSHTVDGRTALNVNYHTAWSDYEFDARASYTDWNFNGNYVDDYPPVTLNVDKARGRWWDTELKLTSHPFQGHRLITGLEYQQDLEQAQINFDDEPRVVYSEQHRTGYWWGVYAEDEIEINSRLLLNAGVRYDDYSTSGNNVNPRLALIYKPVTPTTVKLIYGTAFRAPTGNEMFYADNITSEGNTQLKPEKIKTYEVVVEQRMKSGLQLTGTAFHYSIRDLITSTTDPSNGRLVFENIDRAQVNGLEAQVDKLWTGGAKLRASVTWQHATDPNTDQRLTNSPTWLGKLNAMTPVWSDRAQLGLEAQYVGPRATLNGSTVGGYTVFNATVLSTRIIRGAEISASIYNLFNRRYADPGSTEHIQNTITQDGRTYRLSISYRF